jgi:hypothetical protein
MTMLRKKSIEISLKYVHHTYHVYIDVVFFVIAACHQWVITTKICGCFVRYKQCKKNKSKSYF